MKKIMIYSLLLMTACKKEDVKTEEMVYTFTVTPKEIEADGSSIVTVVAEINPNADINKRGVVFKTSSGDFIGGKDGLLSKKAELEGDKLIAKAQYKAPSKPGTVYIDVKMDLPAEEQEYWKKDSLKVIESTAALLKLSASSFAVMINYGSEVTITGSLLNAKNKPASTGYKILLEDIDQNGNPVGGRFRETQLTSNNASLISAIYSPGFVLPGKKIWIRGTLIDPVLPVIKDSVLIETIQN